MDTETVEGVPVLANISLVTAALCTKEQKSYFEQAEDVKKSGYLDASGMTAAYPKVRAKSNRRCLLPKCLLMNARGNSLLADGV